MNAHVKDVYLSHSARECYLTCPKQYFYKYIQRWSTKKSSANLGFGTSVHAACAAFLISTVVVTPVLVDPIAVFNREWAKFQSTHDIDYGSRWNPDNLKEIGEALVRAFMQWWPTSGYSVVMDAKGKPVVERRLKMRLPGGVIFTTVKDILAMSAEGKVVVFDIKTPAQLAIEGFAMVNDQLTGYQVAGDTFADELGIEQVDAMAFIELHKVTVKEPPKKPGAQQPLQPRVVEPELAERHSQEEIVEWLQETSCIANDIRNKRFPRRPGDSFSSPCKMCDFAGMCLRGDKTGLYIREKRSGSVVELPAQPLAA